jgi:tetratricopeptide (TPR) repeat protein
MPDRSRPAGGVIAMKPEEYQRCLLDALGWLDAPARDDETSAEARIRRAWILFQLGRASEALAAIEDVEPGADRDLAYWAALFRARMADALGHDLDAERSYRAALEIAPGAQTAGVGLAFVLFRLNRFAEAEEMAAAVRNVPNSTSDPWWSYLGADGRFIERWIAQMRRGLP